MTVPDPRMRWWGWGVDRDATALPEKARDMLRQAFSIEDEPSPPTSLDAVALAEPALGEAVRAGLGSIVGEEAVRDDRLARVSHARGRSYPDLVRLRGLARLGSPMVRRATRKRLNQALEQLGELVE